jgi:hypothetical protein
LVIFLDLLEAMCEHRNYGYTRLDGNTNFEERIDAVCFQLNESIKNKISFLDYNIQ